jgi:hypothetical protein
MALPLGDGKGYVEVLLERPKGRARKAEAPMLVAYFLQPDGKSAQTSLPSAVEATGRPPGKDAPVVLRLMSRPVPTTAAGLARFASDPGDLDYDNLAGDLTATRDGQAVTVPFAVR